jgi:hypothetical protein
MNKLGYIEIRITGTEDNLELKPDTYDIRLQEGSVKQVFKTGEIDKGSFGFLELIDYNTKYDVAYLKGLREKAMSWLTHIDPDTWLKEVRGYDA